MKLPSSVARVARLQFTPKAALLIVAPVPLIVLLRGTTAGVTTALWLAALAVLVWRDASRAVRVEDLEWHRDLPVKLSVGVPNRVSLCVRNRSGRPARLTARETPPTGFAGTRSIGPLSVPAHQEASATVHLTPSSRGLYHFGGIGVRSLGPMGLAGWQGIAPAAQEARVYPDIQAVRSYALLARRGALAEMGVRRMRHAGEGTEFESLRDYEPGDDFRDIDWKATARRDRPIVRAFEAERSQTVMLAIDAGRLMTPRITGLSKLDRAVNAALLLAYLAIEREDLVGLLVFGREVERFVPPRKGHRQFLAILEALYSVEGHVEEPDYGRAVGFLGGKLGKRALVVLFTDLAGTEPSRRLLGALGRLMPRHLPLLITQRNRDIEARSRAEAADENDVFASAVAETMLADKAAALSTLTTRGGLVLDVLPEELSIAAVNRYLEVKARGRL